MTAAGGAGLTGNVTINVQGQNQLDALAKSVVRATSDVLKMAQTLPQLDAAQQRQIKSMTTQVGLYTKAASLANTWAVASLKAAEAEKSQANAAGILTAALAGTQTALQNLTGTTQRSYDSKTRTIELSRQNAQVLLVEAQAAKTAAEAQVLLAKAQTETATATRLANGQGAPLSGYERARIALQQKALAAKAAQQAVDNAARADLAAATAASRMEQSAARAAAADQRRAVAATEAAAAARNEVAAQNSVNGALTGSYFALYQVAAGYALLSKAAASVVSTTIGVAAAFQQSFAQVARTTDAAGGELAYLNTQLIQMSQNIPVSFTDIASIAALGGQLGIDAENIASFSETVAKFSAITGISASETAAAFGRITNLLGVNADQYDQLASTVDDLGVKSASTEAEILQMTQSIAATARQAGFSTQDVLGLATALTSLKVAPELARGTLTRLFQNLSSAAASGADGLASFAGVLGLTAKQATDLYNSNPATFFQDLIAGLGHASANGEDLNNVLSDLGIKNSRDVPVIERLAGNYNLLANNVQEAYKEFNKAPGSNRLASDAQTIFDTLNSQAKELGNTLQDAFSNIGGPALAPLEALAGAAKVLVEAFTKLPPAISVTLVSFSAIVAAFAAYKAAIAIALAGTLAFQHALGGQVVGSGINLRTLAATARQTFGTVGQSAQAAAAAVGEAGAATRAAATGAEANTVVILGQARAYAAVSAAATGMTGAQLRAAAATAATANGANLVTASMANAAGAYSRNATAATAAALANQYLVAAQELEIAAGEGAAGSAAVYTAALLRQEAAALTAAEANNVLAGAEARAGIASKLLGGPVFIALAAGAAIITGVAAAFKSSGDAAEAAAKKTQQFRDAFLESVGGTDALTAAVTKDTQAFKDQGAATAGTYATLTRSIKDLNNGTAQVTDQWNRQGQTAQVVASDIYKYASSTSNAGKAQNTFGQNLGLTTDQLTKQTVAIGNNVKALEAKALVDAVAGKDGQGGILSPSQIANIQKSGVDLSKALSDGITKGAPAVLAALKPIIDQVDAQIKAAQAEIDRQNKESGGRGRPDLTIGPELTQLKAKKQALLDTASAVTAMNDATQDSINKSSLFGQVLSNLKIDDLPPELGDAAAATGTLGKEAQDTATHMEDLASAFNSIISAAFDMTDAVGGTQSALDALGKGIVENGLDFSNYTEAGRANLENLKAVVTSYGTELAQQVKTGQITTEQAAIQMQSYVQNLVQTLASQGVDTSQIDYLVNYVNAFTANPATLTIGADGSQAFDTINAVGAAAAQASIQMAAIGVSFDGGQFRNASDAGQNGGLTENVVPAFDSSKYRNSSDAAAQQAAVAASQKLAAARQKQADAEIASGLATAQAAQEMAIAKQQDEDATKAAQAQGAAQKQAGQEAKQAGQQQADAAKQASDALKQEAQYIQAVGQYYAQLSDSAASTSIDQGKVVSSLNELGNAIAVNGTNFDSFSEGGQKNLNALTGALDAYGASLSTKLQNGSISVAEAGAQFSQFAGGVKADLLSLGVPSQEINQLFDSLGAGGGWGTTSAEVSQYSGVVTKAASDSKAFGDAAKSATDKAAESAQKLADYYQAVDDYFKSITDSAFKFVTAEGAVFNSIQQLGAAIVENGTSFNTVTKAGRDNFSALNDVFDSFAANLNVRVSAGAITAQQAANQYSAFAAQIYRQLVQLGVKASDISTFFRSLGIDPTKTAAGTAAVRQYAGVLTTAAAAARAAATGTSALSTAMEQAADYADRLNTALNASFDRLHGVAQAQDAVTSAVQAMSDAYQANIDKVKDLASANKQLQADSQSAQSDYAEANRKYLLAVKYGQKDAAAKFLADRNSASGRISDDTTQIAKNKKESDALKKYGSSLSGNSKEAIANRASYIALQKTMFDQIDAYAKTGASTQQVARYTQQLKVQFEAAGKSAGYSKAAIKTYSDNFTTYATVVRSVPKQIKTTATADTSAATAALNSIPKGSTFRTTAVADTAAARRDLASLPDKQSYIVLSSADAAHVRAVRGVLANIPKRADYIISPKVSTAGGGAKGALQRSVGSGAVGTVHAAVDALSLRNLKANIAGTALVFRNVSSTILSVLGLNVNGSVNSNSMNVAGSVNAGHLNQRAVWMGGTGFAKGGMPGYAAGGLLPGTPPSNPQQDNMYAMSPHGLISVRSREYIQPEPSVDYYGVGMMNAIRNRTFPRPGSVPGYFNGGPVGSYATGGQVDSGNGTMVVQLSTADRKMLASIANRPVVATIDGQRLDRVTMDKQAAAARSGAN